MQDEQFTKVEAEYFRLRGKLAAGRITREQFDAALKQLMFQDAQGRWWWLGTDSGKWFVHDGQAWVEQEPYTVSKPSRATSPAVPPSEPIAPRKRSTLLWVSVLGILFLVLALCASAALFVVFGLRATLTPITQMSPLPPVGTPPSAAQVTVLATSEPPRLLAPKDYAAANDTLAQSIADLNRAELKFVQDAAVVTPNPATLDDDLREVAARAMTVAQTAGVCGLTAIAQGGGSDAAGQTASHYSSIARLSYALVIEAQNVRDGLQARTLARDAAVNTIAEYGAWLWHPGITDPNIKGNPFAPNVKDATTIEPIQFLNSGAVAQLKTPAGTLQTWLAASQEIVTQTVNLPAPRIRVSNPFDSNVQKTLTTASGQSDADRARQVAAAHLTMLTANPTSAPTQIQFAAFKSASIADASQIAAGAVPSFTNGKASALARRAAYPGGAEQLVGEMYLLNGQAPPRVEASTPVKETTPMSNPNPSLARRRFAVKSIARLVILRCQTPPPGCASWCQRQRR